MTLSVIAELLGAGVQLFVAGGRLKARGPQAMLTPALRDRLTEVKPELLKLGNEGQVEVVACLFCDSLHAFVGGRAWCDAMRAAVEYRATSSESCPRSDLRCNSPLTETDGLLFRYYECQKDPSHYFELRGYNGIRPARCPVCNQVEWWRRKDLQGGRETWRCGQCHQPTVPAERFEDTQVR